MLALKYSGNLLSVKLRRKRRKTVFPEGCLKEIRQAKAKEYHRRVKTGRLRTSNFEGWLVYGGSLLVTDVYTKQTTSNKTNTHYITVFCTFSEE
jgi:hypothetical protein